MEKNFEGIIMNYSAMEDGVLYLAVVNVDLNSVFLSYS